MLIETEKLTAQKLRELDEPTTHQLYCGLDCCLTLEVHEELSSLLTPVGASEPDYPLHYSFERALQAPALDMMLRGFKIDQYARYEGIESTKRELTVMRGQLDDLAGAVWDKGLNPGSYKQLKDFFYGTMRLPEHWTSFHGEKKLSLNRESLEKLEQYFHARPLVALILECRDLQKKLSVLETEISPNGRMHTSYNIGGTNTGRWSSSSDVTGAGTNLQNITPELRRMFVADRGWKLCGIDLEQAESREVGWLCGTLFGDWAYLDACEGGDLHTTTCKLIWPDLDWTGDAKRDRELAETNFYRQFSYRDMSKRGGHGCLTGQHEVLTPDGWVNISEKPPVIMAWNCFNRDAQFENVENWIDKNYSGKFVTLHGTSLVITMTADHRTVLYKDKRNAAHVVPALELPNHGLIPLGFSYSGGQIFINEAKARLIAAFQCDGYQKSVNRVEFHFHKERKFTRLQQLASEAGITYERREDKAYLHVSDWPKKAGAYLLQWNEEALRAYITEHRYWDGHIGKTSVSLHSTDRSHLEWLQTIGRLIGFGGNFQKAHISGFGSTVYTLQQNNREFADIASLKDRVIWEGIERVYCPTVPSSFFFIRCEGKISITGNSNYYGTPYTMARHLKVPQRLMENFQRDYFAAFPAIGRWHQWVAEQIQTTGELTTPFGRKRQFFGRRDDDTTLRKAIAFGPQSSTGDRLNLGLWRIWKKMPEVQLLAQVHDAVYFQFRECDTVREGEIVKRALDLVQISLTGSGRTFTIPGEAKVGYNWAAADPKKKTFADGNPEGLIKWSATSPDRRVRAPDMERTL